MAHEIGEMFWYGTVPWHGLGREVREPATAEEALRAGGLDWDVQLVPLAADERPPSPASQRMAVVRSDRAAGDPRRVIGVVHPGFRPLQNRDGATLVDRLIDPGGRKFHAGGYLRNGEVVWLLSRLPARIAVGDGDVVEPYLLYSNSHDGSRAIDIRLATVRVVCRNTLSFALRRASSRAFRRAHKLSPAAIEQDAKAFLAATLLQVDETQAFLRALAAVPCDDVTFARYLRGLVPDPVPPAPPVPLAAARAHDRRRARAADARASMLAIRRRGVPALRIPEERSTWWGALNAVTAWVDHEQPVAGARLAHALLGAGDAFKSLALRHALAAARIGASVAARVPPALARVA